MWVVQLCKVKPELNKRGNFKEKNIFYTESSEVIEAVVVVVKLYQSWWSLQFLFLWPFQKTLEASIPCPPGHKQLLVRQ